TAPADQPVAERLGERLLVNVLVEVDPVRHADRLAVHRAVDGEVRLHGGGVVGRVGDEARHVVDGRPGRRRGQLELVDGRVEVRVPTQPGVVPGVDVVVHIADRVQRVQRVSDTGDIVAVLLHRGALRGRTGLTVGVGDHVRQRVRLDDRRGAQVAICR